MATRKIKPLPQKLTRLLFDLGPRKLVLVEGADDVAVFQEWYRDRRSRLEFYPAEGYDNVEMFLEEYFCRLLARSVKQIGLHDDIQEIVEQHILTS